MLGSRIRGDGSRRVRLPLFAVVLLTLCAPGASYAKAPTSTVSPPDPSPLSCTAADGLFDAGSITAARIAYEQLVPAACATSGISQIREVVRFCDLGRSDLRVHRKGDALTAYKSALAIAPKAECAIAGVRAAGPDGFTRALQWVSTAAPNIPTALTGLGLLLLAGFVILVLLARVSYRGRRLPLERVPGLRTLLRPRIALATISDEGVQWSGDEGQKWQVGASMTAQIKERLQRFREEALSEESLDHDLDFGSTNEAIADYVSSDAGLQTALDKVGELSSSTKIISALVELLYAALPIRRLSVSGVLDPPKLDPPEQSSASVTFSMERGSRLVAAVTLRSPLAQAGKPTCYDYMRLVDQAAIWVQFELTRELTGQKFAFDAADSYARVREGLDRYFGRKTVDARAAFEEALGLDATNWAASIDLTSTEARLSGNYLRAVEVADRAVKDIRRSRRRSSSKLALAGRRG